LKLQDAGGGVGQRLSQAFPGVGDIADAFQNRLGRIAGVIDALKNELNNLL
jgi:hypothetical protein